MVDVFLYRVGAQGLPEPSIEHDHSRTGPEPHLPIAHKLGVAIVTGVYSTDNPIPIESELCGQYNASRTVLREAVKMLTAKGLLARGRGWEPR